MRTIRSHTFRLVILGTIVALAVDSTEAQMPGSGAPAYPTTANPAPVTPEGPSLSAGPYGAPQGPYAAPYMAQNPYAGLQSPYAGPQSPYSGQPNPYAAPQAASPYGPPPGPYAPSQNGYLPAGEPSPFGTPQGPYAPQAADGNPAAPEQALSGACAPCAHPWSFRADEVFLQRSTTRSQSLFVDPTTGADVLNSQTGLNFPVAAGFQVAASRQMVDSWSLEVRYLQLDGWDANHYLPDPSVMVTDHTGPFFPMDYASARYTSAIYMGELNVRQQVNEWWAILAGFRMGELDDRYLATGQETFLVPETATLSTNAFNHLYGFQIGADVKLLDAGPWKLNMVGKAGIYDNAISQDSQRQDLLINDRAQGSVNQVAFLGEADLDLSYQINSHLWAHFTYQAVWLTGVALAPEQIAGTDFASGATAIDSGGSLFYHGGGVAFEVRF